MLKYLLAVSTALVLTSAGAQAQCASLATATVGPISFVSAVTAATAPNPMALVYNPTRSLYYLFYGGNSSYPVEVFSATGMRLTTVSPLGYDFRGVWWNPTTSQLEGNGYSNASIVAKPLDASGYPVATTITTIFAAGNGLSMQNVGTYDPVNNEMVYYSGGTIKRTSRATNATVASAAVTGLPVATTNLNSNVVLYTGCTGREYGLYDAVNKAVYFVSRATNAYVGTSQLPSSAPGNTDFGVTYANGQLYLFNYTTRTWNGYTVVSGTPTAVAAPAASLPKLELLPNPARGQVQVTGATGPVRLLDLTGRLLREQATNTVSLNGLAAGLYVVQSGTSTARLVVE
ncbi:MAG: T9SS type A sorting domain-containing protein [Hymenobacter sp.]|nr:MAG: T9SS type A sorting domain-containing protein [Hymenobacter sp.]